MTFKPTRVNLVSFRVLISLAVEGQRLVMNMARGILNRRLTLSHLGQTKDPLT